MAYANSIAVYTTDEPPYCTEDNPCVKAYEPEVTWVGHPMVSDNDSYTPSQGWIPNVIVGLREDGVVVWKDVKEEE